jgi:23S rRNA pseudouridine2604 synthase
MNINLDVPLGEHRELTKSEFKALKELIKDSKKTYQPPQSNRRNS